MTHTNTTDDPPRRFNLGEMNDLMMKVGRPPVGFLVSQTLWDALEARWCQETSMLSFGPPPQRLNGIQIAIDPDMPEKEFDVAWSEPAWTQRLKEIAGRGHQQRPGLK